MAESQTNASQFARLYFVKQVLLYIYTGGRNCELYQTEEREMIDSLR